jgi:hypothetical protein
MKRTPCLSQKEELKCQTVTHRKLTGNNRVIRKVTKLVHLSNRGLKEETNTIPGNNVKITFERKRDATCLPELDILKFWICIDVKICLLRNFLIIII